MRKLAVLFALALLVSAVSAETSFERSFQEMGFESFAAEGALESSCSSWSFLYPEDINVQDSELYPILSVNAKFSPVASDNAKITVSINGSEKEEFSLKEMHCSESSCWKRIALDKEMINDEENLAEICAVTSNTTTKIDLLNSSLVGAYKIPFMEGFTKTVSKKNLELGEEIEITISIMNSGSRDGKISLKRMRPYFEDIKDIKIFDVLQGEGEWTGTVRAGEVKEISYTIRPNIVSRITLPSAYAEFENVFGEKNQISSNYPLIWVSSAKPVLNVSFEKKGTIFPVGASVPVEVTVKNSGWFEVTGAKLELSAGKNISITKSEFYITIVAPTETVNFKTIVSGNQAGDHEIGCRITFSDGNVSECTGTSIAFEEQKIDSLIYAAIFFLLVGAGIYAYIHFKG